MASGALAAAVLLAGACSSDGADTTGEPTPAAAAPLGAGLTSPTSLGGTLFYYPQAANGEVPMTGWAPEGVAGPTAMVKLFVGDALSSATISPDGKRVAWVASDYDDGTTKLFVANVDGSAKRMLLNEADPYCVEPTWSGDSGKLLTRPVAESSARSLDVATGAVTAFATPIEGCHALWAADGKTIAFSLGPAITLVNADGSNRRTVPKLGADGGPTQRRSHDPMSLSADGRLLSLLVLTGDTPDGDVARGLTANEIVDTMTGATMAIPVPGDLRQAYFLPSGGAVVRVKGANGFEIGLLGPDMKLVKKVSEPANLADMVLLGYGA
jgi:hypothetical protein